MTQCSPASKDAWGRSNRRTAAWDAEGTEALRRRLVRLAVKLVWNREDAEEIVQEAFTRSLTNGPARAEERFVPWMFRTVGNLCLNLRRRRRPERLAAWADVQGAAAPEDDLHSAEQLDRLRSAIEQLPRQQRMALVLRAMEQMDYEHIADIMALSVSAVRAHVHHARRRMAGLLDEARQEARP